MKALILLAFLASSIYSFAQKDFPKQLAGHWQGQVEWYRQGKDTPQKVKMQLIIQPTDTANQYRWKIVYGDKGEDTRPYTLKAVDTAKGHWLVDEHNGILLDQYWIGNKLYAVFSIGAATIVNSYWREGEHLVAEFASFPTKPVRTSGTGTEESPTVESYAVRSYQKAILSRVEAPQKLPLRKPKK